MHMRDWAKILDFTYWTLSPTKAEEWFNLICTSSKDVLNRKIAKYTMIVTLNV